MKNFLQKLKQILSERSVDLEEYNDKGFWVGHCVFVATKTRSTIAVKLMQKWGILG